jgi:hypothetical protein
MFNPLAQVKLIGDELLKEESGNGTELGIIQALLLKFAFAFVLVFCVFVYLDKTSSLNGRTPEENAKIHKVDFFKERRDASEKEFEGINEEVAIADKKPDVTADKHVADTAKSTSVSAITTTTATGRSRKL